MRRVSVAMPTTWPSAWTPASVRPAAVTRSVSCVSLCQVASIVPCTVGLSGWNCQPEYAVPS